jgi:hypothetical protein
MMPRQSTLSTAADLAALSSDTGSARQVAAAMVRTIANIEMTMKTMTLSFLFVLTFPPHART